MQGGKQNLSTNMSRNQKYLGRHSLKLEEKKEVCGSQEKREPKPCFPVTLPGSNNTLKENGHMTYIDAGGHR